MQKIQLPQYCSCFVGREEVLVEVIDWSVNRNSEGWDIFPLAALKNNRTKNNSSGSEYPVQPEASLAGRLNGFNLSSRRALVLAQP